MPKLLMPFTPDPDRYEVNLLRNNLQLMIVFFPRFPFHHTINQWGLSRNLPTASRTLKVIFCSYHSYGRCLHCMRSVLSGSLQTYSSPMSPAKLMRRSSRQVGKQGLSDVFQAGSGSTRGFGRWNVTQLHLFIAQGIQRMHITLSYGTVDSILL